MLNSLIWPLGTGPGAELPVVKGKQISLCKQTISLHKDSRVNLTLSESWNNFCPYACNDDRAEIAASTSGMHTHCGCVLLSLHPHLQVPC